MVEIDQCIYRVLHWSILVHFQRQISIQLYNNVNFPQCFNIFLSDDNKEDAATTTAQIKCLIALQ